MKANSTMCTVHNSNTPLLYNKKGDGKSIIVKMIHLAH